MSNFSKLVVEGDEDVDYDTVEVETEDGRVIEIPEFEALNIVNSFAEHLEKQLKNKMRDSLKSMNDAALIGENSDLLDDDEMDELRMKNRECGGEYDAYKESIRVVYKSASSFFEDGGEV